MPADFLSRNAVDAIRLDDKDLKEEQSKDPKLKALYDFLLDDKIPGSTSEEYRFVKMFKDDSFIENGTLWRRIRRFGEPDRVVLYAPPSMREAILQEAHGAPLAGHDGQLKTKERI